MLFITNRFPTDSIRTVAEQVYGGSEEGHEDGLFVTKPL